MNYEYLYAINSPSDLKALRDDDMPRLAEEIRAFLIEKVETAGGHLASNLGVVELTLALHRMFDSPADRIIFDVGHQSYVHKLLTGRRDDFSTLRTPGGLSGFTSRRESPHDPFGAGHSSTAVSAALGFAEADRLSGERRYTVCVVGDGAYTGGMVHEALNNCKSELPLVIVLNENGMSISSNKGAFAAYLSRVRVSSGYRRLKRGVSALLSRIPLVGKPTKRLLGFIKRRIKKLVYRQNYFEQLGLYYIGPIDGNDYGKCARALKEAKELGRSVVVHVKTKKGKGYAPAEDAPDEYHNLAAYKERSFRDVAAEELIRLAGEDKSIVAVTAAMGIGTGLCAFGETYPDRYFDVGIAEPHALTFSAGLAAAGLSPFAAIYSTFLQRGYDNIIHDIALQQLPVKLLIDRTGLSLSDGATHHGIFDAAFLSHVPGMTVLSPITYSSLRQAIKEAASADGPVAVRYPGTAESERIRDSFSHIGDGVYTDFDVNRAPENIFVTYGALAENALAAEQLLAVDGISAGTVILERLKPLAPVCDRLLPILSGVKLLVLAEEGVRRGGVMEALSSAFLGKIGADVKICAIDDSFAAPEHPSDLYDCVGLSPEKLAREVSGK